MGHRCCRHTVNLIMRGVEKVKNKQIERKLLISRRMTSKNAARTIRELLCCVDNGVRHVPGWYGSFLDWPVTTEIAYTVRTMHFWSLILWRTLYMPDLYVALDKRIFSMNTLWNIILAHPQEKDAPYFLWALPDFKCAQNKSSCGLKHDVGWTSTQPAVWTAGRKIEKHNQLIKIAMHRCTH